MDEALHSEGPACIFVRSKLGKKKGIKILEPSTAVRDRLFRTRQFLIPASL